MRRSGTSEVVIVGSGVVGTATGKGFVRHGHPVRFVDANPAHVQAVRAEGYRASVTIDLPKNPAFSFLTLPTPAVGHRYELSALAAGTAPVGDALKRSDAFHTVVVRSTGPPGTCEGLIGRLLEERSGKRVDEDFALASNPAFRRAASGPASRHTAPGSPPSGSVVSLAETKPAVSGARRGQGSWLERILAHGTVWAATWPLSAASCRGE